MKNTVLDGVIKFVSVSSAQDQIQEERDYSKFGDKKTLEKYHKTRQFFKISNKIFRILSGRKETNLKNRAKILKKKKQNSQQNDQILE